MPFSSKKSSLILILDIQSSVVRGSLCVLAKNARPHVIYSQETPIEYKQERGAAHLVQRTIRAIDQTLHHALRSIQGKKIDAVHYVLSSPWILSQAKTIAVEFKKETKATREHIIDIVTKQREEFITEKQSGFEIVEEKVFSVKLDGTHTEDWRNKKARTVDVSLAISVSGIETIRQLRDVCAHAVPGERVQFHSALLLQHIAVQQIIPQYKNYTLIHAHGELTDIIRVKDGTCSFFASYPYGTQTILRSIGSTQKIPQQSAESNLALYGQGSLDASHARKTYEAIQNEQHMWSAELMKILQTSSVKQDPNEHILLSAHAYEAFFIRALASIPHYGKVQRLELDDVRPAVTFEASVRTSRMTGLYVLAIHSINQ